METVPQQEIERKWILKCLPSNIIFNEVITIQQYYVKIDGKPCRIRYSSYHNDPDPENVKTEVIHKENVGYGSNIEHHYNITREEADSIIDALPIEDRIYVHKVRYVKNYDGYKVEIDNFYGVTLIMMEVEVPHIDFPIVFDELIEKEILMEVTGNKNFNNYNLTANVFR